MKKTFAVLALLALLLNGASAENGVTLSEDRLATLETITKLSDYEDYNFYSMEVLYDYDLTHMMPVGETDTQSCMDLVLAEVMPGVDINYTAPDFGCSAFTLPSGDGQYFMGRNYDFSRNSSCMMVYCHPKDGYASVAHCALNNLNADDPESSDAAKLACLAAPFLVLDGINEKGVGIAVLTLDSEPVAQNTGKAVLATPILIRLVLDKAATTQEAVDLLSQYDMYASSGRDYHFYITDATGDGRVIEFDPESEDRPMIATPTRTVTNFFMLYPDKVEPNQRNGIYGHGKERWEAIEQVIEAHGGVGDKDVAWEALLSAVQEPNPESITSNTQWSVIYNLNDLSYEIILRRHLDDVFYIDTLKK